VSTERDSGTDKPNEPTAQAQNAHAKGRASVNLRVLGPGELGNRFVAALMTYLAISQIIEVVQDPTGEIDITTVNPYVDLGFGLLDVDFRVVDEITKVVDDNQLLAALQDRQLTLVGNGVGREWRRMVSYFDQYDELETFLQESVTASPQAHLTLEFAGLVGGTGMGTIREHINRIQAGNLPSPAERAGVYIPVTIGPSLRQHDQAVNAVNTAHERLAFENVYEHLPEIRHAIQDGAVSANIFADNAQLSLLRRLDRQTVPLPALTRLQAPIRTSNNWFPFIEDYRYEDHYAGVANNGERNAALYRALLPLLYSAIRPPELDFDGGDSHFDRQEQFGALEGVRWIPGHLWLADSSEVAALVPDSSRPESAADALYPATQYASYSVAGGFHTDAVDSVLAYVHLTGDSLSDQDHGLISRTIADELGISRAKVTTVEVAGMQDRHFPGTDDPELAINVMVGVTELETTYRALGEQTLA